MIVGKLDNYVRIEVKSATSDSDYGGEVVAWVPYAHAWASVTDITTRQQESTMSDLRQLKRPCRVMMRYNKNITTDMRIVMLDRDNRILEIVSKPAEIGRKEAIEFMAHDYT